jgi:hypothetical protein
MSEGKRKSHQTGEIRDIWGRHPPEHAQKNPNEKNTQTEKMDNFPEKEWISNTKQALDRIKKSAE